MSSDSVVKRKISLPSVLVSEVDIASFRQLLENERNLLELRKDSDSTARLARSLTRLYDRLRQANSFCVLLDFDTIYHFISTEPFSDSAAGLDALSLEAFFLEGKMPYAIPLGAYRELFNHLRHFGLAKNPKFPRSAHDEAGAVSPRRVIYDVLSFISDEEIPDDEDIGGIVDDAVEASTNEQTRLARLFSILLSPRFRGIRNVYNSRECEGWKEVQRAHKRRWAGDNIDQAMANDALNLGIAFSDFLHFARHGHERKGPETFLLLTRTGAIFNLLSNLEKNSEMQTAAQHFLGVVPSLALQEKFPAIFPQRLALLEMFGPVATPLEAEEIYNHVIGLANVTSDFLQELDEILKDFREKRGRWYEARKQHLIASLQQLIAVAKAARSFEEKRRTLASIQDAAHRSLGERPGHFTRRSATEQERVLNDTGFQELSASAPSILDQIHSLLNEVPGFVYESTISPEVSGCVSFVVHQSQSIRSEVLRGLFFINSKGTESGFELQWLVTTSERELYSGLKFLYPNGLEEVSKVPAKLRPSPFFITRIDEESPLWTFGVVLVTTEGCFGIEPSDAFLNFDWLDYSFLGRSIYRGFDLNPVFTRVVIAAPRWILEFDVMPRADDHFLRHVKYRCQNPSPREIVALVNVSTQYYTDIVALEKKMDSLMSDLKNSSNH